MIASLLSTLFAAVLHVVTNGLYEETYDIQVRPPSLLLSICPTHFLSSLVLNQQSALGCIRNIVQNQNGLSDEPLVDLRHITDCISEMESRVNRYVSSSLHVYLTLMSSLTQILDADT